MAEPFFQLRSSEVVPLTVDIAERFRDMAAAPVERELNPRRVKYLRDTILAGRGVSFHWVSAMLNGEEYRMNGNSSSNALCALNGSFPDGLTVHREVFDVADMEGMALLFRQFDARQSSRSPRDVSGAYQGIYKALRDVPRGTAKLGLEGITFHARQVLGAPIPSGDDIYTKFGDSSYHAFLCWLGDTITIKTPEMANKSVCAAMFATFEANEAAARDFWNDVARGGIEFDETAPATTLDTWLKELKDSKCRKAMKVKEVQIYQGCIYAWTAYREDRPLKQIKWDTKKGIHEVVN